MKAAALSGHAGAQVCPALVAPAACPQRQPCHMLLHVICPKASAAPLLPPTLTAQVGINGEGAVGARVQVWWEGDQTFYSGLLAHYDPVSTE